MKNKIIAAATLALCAVLGAGAPTAQERETEPRVLFVTHGAATDGFWGEVKRGAEAAAADLGVAVEYRAPETFDVAAMARLIDEAAAERPDGLVVSVPDADALAPHIRAAADLGIPVIGVNSGMDVSASLGAKLHVGQNEYDSGRAAGERMREAGGKRAVCVNHQLGNIALDLRCKGFIDGFGGSVEVLSVPRDAPKIRDALAERLAAAESIDVVLALGAATAGEPVLEAVAASGRPDRIRFATFDVTEPVLRAVAEGRAAFAIDQQPFLQGYLPVQFLALLAREGVIPVSSVRSGPMLVGAEEARARLERTAPGEP